jgi:hypothetical protein
MKMVALILGPPVLAMVWWVASRLYAHIYEGSRVSDLIRRRQALGFWLVLMLFYALAIVAYLFWPRMVV